MEHQCFGMAALGEQTFEFRPTRGLFCTQVDQPQMHVGFRGIIQAGIEISPASSNPYD